MAGEKAVYKYWQINQCPCFEECSAPSWKKTHRCISWESEKDQC